MPAAALRPLPPRRKRFGQHFLHDPAIIGRIVRAIDPRLGDHLVEIGPGRGALTAPLLEEGFGSLDVIEIDRDLAARLRERFGADSGWVLHEADALQFDYAGLARERGGALRVVGNLPYNISTPLLFRLLEAAPVIADLTIMLQREVAARLAARPGESGYGRLSVMLAPLAEVSRLFDVGPGAFQPPPKVWSAVVRVSLRAAPAFPVSPHYAAVVAAAFAQRRKTLRNALSQLLTREQISACAIDPAVRPERLAPQEFNTLAQALDRADGGR
jgi:16S rRNA (adenine1518-N6/adenine1519-N6)-dimethyltransferase